MPRPTQPVPPQRVGDTEPLVILMTESLSLSTVRDVEQRVRDLTESRRVVIDVTAVPAFDSEGTAALLTLQRDVGDDRLVVIGLREASARLVGTAGVAATGPPLVLSDSIRLRKLPGLVMLTSDSVPAVEALRDAISVAIAEDVAIVVVDMSPMTSPPAGVVDVLRTASSQAAAHGQELVLVNVSEEAAMSLRSAGLAPTTYLAVST